MYFYSLQNTKEKYLHTTAVFKNKAASMVSQHVIGFMHVVSIPFYDGNATNWDIGILNWYLYTLAAPKGSKR